MISDFGFGLKTTLFIVAVQFAAYFVKGLAGFGDALISPPLISLTSISVGQLIPGNLCINAPINALLAYKNRRSYSVRSILPMLSFNIAGMVPGVLVLRIFGASDYVKAALGIVIFCLGIEMFTRRCGSVKGSFPLMALYSLSSGFMSGMFGINLLFVSYMDRTGYSDRDQFKGQMCFIFFVENILRLTIYIIAGMYTLPVLLYGAVSAVGGFAGLFVGGRVEHGLKDSTVRTIIIITFMLAGLSTFVKSVAGLMR